MPQVGVINFAWFGLAGGRLDAEFWLKVTETLAEREIRPPQSATLDQVKAAIGRVDTVSRETETRVRQLRAEAQDKLREARQLERTLPRYPVTQGGPRRPAYERPVVEDKDQ